MPTVVEPLVTEVRTGWLACTPPDHAYRVGVIGSSREDAVRNFEVAMNAWAQLHSRPVMSGR